jgi:hypothetical protein
MVRKYGHCGDYLDAIHEQHHYTLGCKHTSEIKQLELSLSGLLSAPKKLALSYVIFFFRVQGKPSCLLTHLRPLFEICYDTSGRRT